MNINEKDIDTIISKHFKNLGDMPENIERYIKNTEVKPTRKFKVIEIIKIIATCGTLLCGTVCATYYIDKYPNVYDEGVKNAIKNGYVYEPENIAYSRNENLKVGIDSLLLDDYNLNMDVSLEFNKDINIEGYEHFKIENVIMYDEENNIYYNDNANIIYTFAKNKNISEDNLHFVGGSSGISIYNINENKGTLNLSLKTENHKLPESKKIYLEFNTIKFAKNIDETKADLNYNGEWKTEIVVPDKFQNRNNILYSIDKCDSRIYKDKFKVEVTETGTKLNLEMQWGDYEYWTKKTEEIRKQDVMASSYINTENSYIENEKGEKFYATFEGSGARLFEDGTLKVMCNFSCLKSDSTDKMKIVLLDINGKVIEIEIYK